MGKLDLFDITFNNPQRVFYAGQIVDGYVTVKLNDAMKMRGIKLSFVGKAYVHWTERHSTGSGKNRRTETRHYSATEYYFNFELLLFGPGNDSVHLPAGHYTYPFSYQLPINLPSSFETGIGNVRYFLKAKIDKPWKFDHTTKKMFNVIANLDLNAQPNAMQPLNGQNEKFLCCLCCKSGPISATFHIDRTGYVPGDTIVLNAEINNLSNRVMDCSRVKLVMVTLYHATSKTKTVNQEVMNIRRGEIQPGDSDQWSGVTATIPAVPPSYLVGCNIIDIRYILKLEVDPSGPAFDLEIPLEIMIGTIPLRQVVERYYPPLGGATGHLPQPNTLQPSAPPNPAPIGFDLPPPSYTECVFGKQDVANDEGDDEHTRGDRDFAPSYIYYDWSKHPNP